MILLYYSSGEKIVACEDIHNSFKLETLTCERIVTTRREKNAHLIDDSLRRDSST